MKRAAVALLLCCGCFEGRYLSQATKGQVSLLANARTLSLVVNDNRTEPRVARLLSLVPDVKQFGEHHGLTATGNYERYTDLHRSAAVWVVQACEPLAFKPKRWHFPIVGSVPYLGFFEQSRAAAYADELRRTTPLDVDVRGASAYSTLGWFRDPVLSTMLSDGPEALGGLVNTVLHESVHATVYVNGQSSFDESLASFVGDALTVEWLASRPGLDSKEAKAWVELEAQGSKRVQRLHRAYEELEALYTSDRSDDEKRAQKAAIYQALQTELGTRRTLNNASLSGYRTYDTGGPAFEKLRVACGGNWPCFLKAISSLRESDFPAPQLEDFSPVVETLVGRVTGRAGDSSI